MRLIICLSFSFILSSPIFASGQRHDTLPPIIADSTKSLPSEKIVLETDKNPRTDEENQAHFAPVIFPNYFKCIPEAEALAFIDKSIASVLSRLEIPYVDPARPTKTDGTPNILKTGFFIELEAMIQRADPGAKVYISGGVVRSILGYLYKKMYHEHQRALVDAVNHADVNMPQLVHNTLDRIIDGRSRKFTETTNDNPIGLYKVNKDMEMLTALGIGSDLDILVKFSANFKGDKNAIMNKATDFINSAETALELGDDRSALKKSIVPIGDIKDYDKQVGADTSGKNAVAQGGSSLDWLAFPVTTKSGSTMVMPKNYQNTMHYFWNGELDYIKSPDTTVPEKQTIRGLRALLEMPFLTYTPEGMMVIKTELEALIAKGSLDSAAKEQIGKMIRNARFEGAKNRFASSIKGLPADGIEGLVKQLGAKHISAKIPEFMVKRDPALRRGADKGGLATAGILMSVDTFIENHTDKGILYHGTPDFTDVLNMIRNGMILSKHGQGTSRHGRGVYTKKISAQSYSQGSGVILELQVQRDGLRVLDWETAKEHEEIIKLFPNAATAIFEDLDTIFEQLTTEYDIDIIINTYPLIQNAAAIKLPKKSRDIIKLQIQQAEKSLSIYMSNQDDTKITQPQLIKWFTFLHHNGKFSYFHKFFGISISTKTKQYLQEALLKNLKTEKFKQSLQRKNIFTVILSDQKENWTTNESDKIVYNTAWAAVSQYMKSLNSSVDDTNIKLVVELLHNHVVIDEEGMIYFLNNIQNVKNHINLIKFLIAIRKKFSTTIISSDEMKLIFLKTDSANKIDNTIERLYKIDRGSMYLVIQDTLNTSVQ